MTEDFHIISVYSRAQAIEDGVLVDASETAREAGFTFPVAITRAAWDQYVEVPEETTGQDVKGRLWDVLTMLRFAIKRSNDGSEIQFKLHVAMPDAGNWQANEDVPERGSGLTRATHRLVTLKAVVGPGDDPKPVITIMRPEED